VQTKAHTVTLVSFSLDMAFEADTNISAIHGPIADTDN